MKYKLVKYVDCKKTITLEDFVKKYGLEMVVYERDPDLVRKGYGAYYAFIPYLEVKNDNALLSSTGDGDTPEDAIKDYIKQISGQNLVIGAYRLNRVDIEPIIIKFSM